MTEKDADNVAIGLENTPNLTTIRWVVIPLTTIRWVVSHWLLLPPHPHRLGGYHPHHHQVGGYHPHHHQVGGYLILAKKFKNWNNEGSFPLLATPYPVVSRQTIYEASALINTIPR